MSQPVGQTSNSHELPSTIQSKKEGKIQSREISSLSLIDQPFKELSKKFCANPSQDNLNPLKDVVKEVVSKRAESLEGYVSVAEMFKSQLFMNLACELATASTDKAIESLNHFDTSLASIDDYR